MESAAPRNRMRDNVRCLGRLPRKARSGLPLGEGALDLCPNDGGQTYVISCRLGLREGLNSSKLLTVDEEGQSYEIHVGA